MLVTLLVCEPALFCLPTFNKWFITIASLCVSGSNNKITMHTHTHIHTQGDMGLICWSQIQLAARQPVQWPQAPPSQEMPGMKEQQMEGKDRGQGVCVCVCSHPRVCV